MGPELEAGLTVGELAKDVEMTRVPGGLLGHVQQYPSQRHDPEVVLGITLRTSSEDAC